MTVVIARVLVTARVLVLATKRMNSLFDLLPPHLKDPNTFKVEFTGVREFAEWYIKLGMPFMPPKNPHVYITDDARSIVLLRLGQFQVELYLMDSDPIMGAHGHPDIDVITLPLSGLVSTTSKPLFSFLTTTGDDDAPGEPLTRFGFSEVLTGSEKHGNDLRLAINNGLPLLAFQHWKTREPSTVSAVWDGKLIGPKHLELLNKYNPSATISADGYVINKD